MKRRARDRKWKEHEREQVNRQHRANARGSRAARSDAAANNTTERRNESKKRNSEGRCDKPSRIGPRTARPPPTSGRAFVPGRPRIDTDARLAGRRGISAATGWLRPPAPRCDSTRGSFCVRCRRTRPGAGLHVNGRRRSAVSDGSPKFGPRPSVPLRDGTSQSGCVLRPGRGRVACVSAVLAVACASARRE